MNQEMPLPGIDPLTKPFWEGTKRHKLMMQKCPSCGRFHWLPASSCQSCGNPALTWEEVKKTGTIFTFTEVNKVVRNVAFQKQTPYLIAMAQLDDGPRIIANVPEYGSLDRVKIGAKVEVIFDDITSDITLPRFRIIER
ncbi:MAG: Zn-ribbon domain-containing OB-fold protein [Nitrososphaerota archaeon]|nr:Zn-ribbon domain-containing OB-fold protein [Nitrososphaerota archaeon]